MYICIHIHILYVFMFTHMCMHKHVFTHMCMHKHKHIARRVQLCQPTHAYICIHVCIYMYTCVCVYICNYVSRHMYIYKYI